MKNILLLISLVSFVLGDTLSINNDLTSVSTSAYQSIIEDKHKSMSALDILEDRYKANYYKDRVGSTRSVFWNKLVIKNNAGKNIPIVFQNQRSGMDKIDVFIYKNKQLIKTHSLGDQRDQNQRDNLYPKSVFHLDFPAYEEYTIVSRLENLGPITLSWDIYNEYKFLKKSNLVFMFNGLFAGVFIALLIYNFMMFISLKDISFLLYIFVAFSLLWMQYIYSGMLYFLDIGINLSFLTISAWFVPFLYIGLLILFAISFFKIYEKNRYIFYLFIGLSILGFTLSFLSLYLFVDSDFATYTPYTYIFFYISLILIFIYALYASFNGYSYAYYFLIGEGVYLAAIFYSILVITSVIPVSNSLEFIVPSAMMLEVLLLSVALSKRVKVLRQKSDENEVLLLEESRFSAIGKGIGNVSHQWKTPLSQLNTHLLYLQGLYHTGDEKKLVKEFGENIENIDYIMKYMKSSMEELHDFYSDVNTSVKFKLKKQILLAMALQNDQLILNNISVNIICDDELSLVGAKHGFANILMILFDNSIFQFEKQKTADAKIDIKVVKVENKIDLYFKDNAGGIKVDPIDEIFDIHYTTKETKGSGLGLPLAKALSKKAVNGDISVKNSDNGAEFTLTVFN